MSLKDLLLRERVLAIFAILLVSLIWASSFVIVKVGLAYLHPLTLAGMRYFAAFLLLAPWLIAYSRQNGNPARGYWKRLFVMGVCAYPLGNGTLFWGLQYLPATTGSFLLSLIPLPVLFLAILWLREIPTRWQVVGLLATLVGSSLFFSPGLKAEQPSGVLVVGLGLFAFAIFGVLGRGAARGDCVDTLPLTAIPLGFGGSILLVSALVFEGMPNLSFAALAIILWLAIVNTALAHLLVNRALRILTALEVNVLLNLSPLGTALLAAFTLNERLGVIQLIGMVVVILGAGLVQWKPGEPAAETARG